MPNSRNSPGRRQRGGSRSGDSGKSFSGKRKSEGRSDKRDSEKRPYSKGDGKKDFGKKGGFSKGPGRDKPFKKFGKRDDASSGERRRPSGDRRSGKPGAGEGRERSWGSRDQRREGGARDEKPTRRFDSRSEGRSERGGYRPKSDSKRDEGSRPFKRRSDSDSGERRRRNFDGDRSAREPRDKKFGDRRGKREGTEERGFFKKSKDRFDSKPPKETSFEERPAQTEKIRLNKYIANSGVCSRREADELITMGLIAVNGKTITELGYKVNPGDEVRYENKILKAEKLVYILLNKPKGYLTTTEDPQDRNTVMHIVGNAVKERIYPVGRLDRNTTGLLLLTNDGELAEKLMHPSYNVKKIYKVELDRPLTKADFETILGGVQLEEGRAMVDDLAIVSDDGKTVGVEIHIGWNRVVRRIFEALQYEVVKLDRSVYAGLDKKDLGRGEWRFLSKEEIVRLKHFK